MGPAIASETASIDDLAFLTWQGEQTAGGVWLGVNQGTAGTVCLRHLNLDRRKTFRTEIRLFAKREPARVVPEISEKR